ncbi:MAG TPA: hypothetical protein VHX15_14260 [Frankiaceae bacterium]|jgi:hypothetical protein|nr:hypothetical protein [Frankiaceae bacterium]
MTARTATLEAPVAGITPPKAARTFHRIMLLLGAYTALSVLTLAAIVILRRHAGIVNSAVWTRAIIVVVSALVTLRLAAGAARGSRRAFLRVRIISAVVVVAIAVIVALPGTFPLWMKIEQSVCGLLLIGVVALVNGRELRSLFAAR